MNTTRTSQQSSEVSGGADAAGLDLACPVCGADSEVFYRAADAPVFCNALAATRQEALAAPRGRIALAGCAACGHVFNAACDESLLTYGPSYENALHFSGTFQRYAEDLAGHLVEGLDLRGKRLVEIGCGDGYFLDLLCRAGGNTGIGFDPAYRPHLAHPPGVEYRAEVFSPTGLGADADLLCCRHVLEHLRRPRLLVEVLRDALGRRPDARVFCEVPNGLHTFDGEGLWDVLYEHTGYFTATSLPELFRRGSLEPLSVWTTYHGQFLALVARPAPPRPHVPARRPGADFAACLRHFAARVDRKVRHWQDRLAARAQRGESTVLWGAGSKGVMFLNALGDWAGLIDRVVDVSPRKAGRFIPVTGQGVVPPEDLAAAPPSAVIVMNPLYHDEVAARLRSLGVTADLLPV